MMIRSPLFSILLLYQKSPHYSKNPNEIKLYEVTPKLPLVVYFGVVFLSSILLCWDKKYASMRFDHILESRMSLVEDTPI